MSGRPFFNPPSLQKKLTIQPQFHSTSQRFKPKSSMCLDIDQKQLRETNATLSQTPKARKTLKSTDFKILRLLGNGKFGAVYLVKHIESGFVMAMKVISKAQVQCDTEAETQKMVRQLIQEIKIQMFLEHPNLIKLYSFFSDHYKVYLLMELGCDGQLFEYIKDGIQFSEEATSFLVRQTLLGISEMHKYFVIHRDIKPENIVLSHGVPKICDFGWAAYCPKEVRSTLCGTPLYLSPEILKGKTYNEKIDTWAIGTLAYELMTATNPFQIRNKSDLKKIITESVQMEDGSAEARNFIMMTLEKDPDKRPTTASLLSHPFIRKFQELETCQELCTLVHKSISASK